MRIVAIILLCCVSLLCVGCVFDNTAQAPGDDMGNYDPDNPEIPDEYDPENAVISMYGSKVLYRPNSYDYDAGSGGNGEKNNYYGNYAFSVLEALYNFYGITSNAAYINQVMTKNDVNYDVTQMINNLPYFYDSIRYQVNAIGTVTHEKVGEGETEEIENSKDQYFFVAADHSSHWKWSFDYDVNEAVTPFISVEEEAVIYSGNYIYNILYGNEENFKIEYPQAYDVGKFKDNYQKIYLGTSDKADEENYSDFVKTMEYVVYSYALNLEPQAVNVTINRGDNQIFDPATGEHNLYRITIGSYDNVDAALEDITDLFHKIGSHVGLMKDQIRKIANWIKVNVIGLDTNIKNDTLSTYDSATAVYDAEGNLIDIEFAEIPSTETNVNRNYDEAVDKIVNYVCQFATIGSDSDGDVTIDDRFLASEVKEYAGDTFFIGGDENFPKPPENIENLSPKSMLPLEYQSVVIMLDKPVAMSDMAVALKYDADLSGTTQGVYDMSKYLDIIVELNYYSHRANRLITIDSQRTRVYDGPYEFGVGPDTYPEYNLPDDHGTVWFTIDGNNPDYKDLLIDTDVIEGVLPIGAFNTDIGGGILKTDVGHNGYKKPLVSKNPLILVGTTDVRKYYSIIEPDDGEIGDPELTYTTGRLNPDKFSGSDGCDYLEITYKVLKKKGDRNTNYSFYTGLVNFMDADIN